MGTSFKSVWKPWDPKLIWNDVIYTVFYPQIFTIFLKRLTWSDFISTPHKSSPYETPSEMERVHRKIKSLSCRVLFSWKHFFYCSRVCMHTSARTTSNMESGWERKYGMKARLQWNTQTPTHQLCERTGRRICQYCGAVRARAWWQRYCIYDWTSLRV